MIRYGCELIENKTVWGSERYIHLVFIIQSFKIVILKQNQMSLKTNCSSVSYQGTAHKSRLKGQP